MSVSLELLTDDAILDYTTKDGLDMVVKNHYDVNLKKKDIPIEPIQGGLYDITIFGSPFIDRCVCGNLKKPGPEPCPNCGSRVFTREESLRRFARIELPFYYLNILRYDAFLKLFNSIFEGSKIKLDFKDGDFYNFKFGTKAGKPYIKCFDMCQFDYDPKRNELTISEFITDEAKASYEGILAIVEKHFKNHAAAVKKFLNRYYLILPAAMRPVTIGYRGGKKTMCIHKLTSWYKMLVYFTVTDDVDANSVNYNDVMSQLKSPGERVRYRGLLKAFINSGRRLATRLLNSSKENLAREIYSVNADNSARCPIVPDPDIAIDEITVPKQIAYEMCREGFQKYLVDELNFSQKNAEDCVKYEWNNPETEKLFKEFAENQYVLVNRQPTLHEYGFFCCKLRLNDNYTIGFPLQLCGPLGADFDGDTVTVQLVPPDAAEETYERMSPRYTYYYKKNGGPIFEFNHETLNGLAVVSQYTPDDPKELKDPRYYYTTYEDVLRDAEVEKKIKLGTPICFTGEVGGVKYNRKITTYGRLRLSKILEADIDKLKIFDDPSDINSRITAKAAAKLSVWLNNRPEDGIEKRQKIQKFALQKVTQAGVVTFDYKTLYVDTNTETYQKIKKVVDDPELSDKQKTLMISTYYKKFEKEVSDKFSDDLKKDMSLSNRVKMPSITAMTMPGFIISGVEEKPKMLKGTLLDGLSEEDYQFHTIENRSLLRIKQDGVPTSGYLNRQINFLMSNYIYTTNGEDKDQKTGLFIPRYRAAGRISPSGEKYKETKKESEDDLVPVRSIVTKTTGNLDEVTPDLISTDRFTDLTDGTAIGLSFATSMTESVTQGLMALKHGGHERMLSSENNLIAPADCEVEESGNWLLVKLKGGTVKKYLRPANIVMMGNNTKFNKGDIICSAYHATTPAVKVKYMTKLLGANLNSGVQYFEKDIIIISQCYAADDGVIEYIEDNMGKIKVKIGKREYEYNENCLYYYPAGTTVKKYQRICSGLADMFFYAKVFTDDVQGLYMIFRKQFYSISVPDFNNYLEDTTIPSNALPEEMVELAFRAMINGKINKTKKTLEDIQYYGTTATAKKNGSFFRMISFQDSASAVKAAIRGEAEFTNDLMTDTVLGLLLNSNL